MKINKLSIRNFGIIDQEDLYFDDGLYVFSGDNGEGKSTVLKALSLILFNKVPGKLSDYIQWEKSEAFVRCEFIHNSVDYQTTLAISKKGSERWLYCGDTKDELSSTSGVTEKLNDILDIKRAIASTTSFEHEIDLINTSPSERREYLKRVYDLSFKRESEKIEADIQEAKEESIRLKSEIDNLKAQEFELYALERPPMSSTKFDEIKQEIKEKRDLLKSKEKELDQYQSQLESAKEDERTLIKLEQDIEDIKREIDQKLKKIVESKNTIDTLNSFNIKTIFDSYKEKKNEIHESLSELEMELENYKNALEDRIPRHLEAIGYDSKDHDEVKKNLQELKFQIKDLEKKNSELSNGICPICGTSFETHDLEDFEKELEDKRRELDYVESELTDQEDKKSQAEDLEKSIPEYESNVKEINLKIENLRDKRNHLEETEQKEIDNKKKEIEKEIETQNNLITIYTEEIDNRRESISQIEEKMSALKKSIEDIRKIYYQVELLERETTDLDLAISELEEKIEKYNEVLSSNESKRKINEDLERKKEERDQKVVEATKRYEKNEQNLETYKQSLKLLTKDFPSFVLSRLVDNLSNFTNEFLQQVYPKYTLEFKESKSSLSVMYNGVDVKLASGFEKQVFSFAYKYALGKIQNYNILFLDEVDSAASEENSKLFYETLAKMQNFFHQIFVITHKEDTKDLLKTDYDATVYNVDKGVIKYA